MRRLALLVAVIAVAAACQPEKSPRQSTASAAAAAPAAGQTAAIVEPVTFTPVGHPAGACMTEEEIAAEQTIRLHTAMMVTGLTCHGFYREPALFNRFQDFTIENEVRLGAAQDAIGTFLARYESGRGLFDTYQTQVANAESRLVAEASAPTYCRLRRDQFYTASTFTEVDLEAYVDLMVDHHRDSYQVCR